MSGSDEENWLGLVGGDIKPLAVDTVVHGRSPRSDDDNARARRAAAEADGENLTDHLSDERVEMLDPYDVLSLCKPGVQHGVFRKLRLGQYPQEATLDLHQLSLREARTAVMRFIRDCLRHEIRCALIIHGLGLRAKPPAMMKSHVNHWLRQIDEVLAFHSSQKPHGGLGAVYVLLRKGQKERQFNRERHQKRLG